MTRINSNTKMNRSGVSMFQSGAANGSTIDVQGFKSLCWVGGIAPLTGGGVLIAQHSDDGTNWTDVPEADLHGRDPSLSGDGELCNVAGVLNIRVGLTSKKRYHRVRTRDDGSLNCFPGAILLASKHSHAQAGDQFMS